MDNIYDQIVNISKAGAFDVVSKQRDELAIENKALKEDLETWKKIALGYREIITEHEKNCQQLLK